jgi:hypothetical protein
VADDGLLSQSKEVEVRFSRWRVEKREWWVLNVLPREQEVMRMKEEKSKTVWNNIRGSYT